MIKNTHSKANIILLCLSTIWTTIILFAYAIPSLKSAIIFLERIKFEIIGGYTSNFFIQIEVIWYIVSNIFFTLTYTLVTIFLIITILKPTIIKATGRMIIFQNIILILLDIWNKFLTNKQNETILIDITHYLVIVIIISIMILLLSIKPKIFVVVLSLTTLLQILNTMSSFTQMRLDNIYAIFEHLGEVLILCFYWIIFLSYK